MAFLVETGANVADANALIDVAYFRGYHAERGREFGDPVSDGMVQGWIVRATDYFEKRFGGRLKGDRSYDEQSLSLPRANMLVDGKTLADDAIPVSIKNAIAEYALRASQYDDLTPDPPVAFDRKDSTGATVSSSGVLVGRTEKVEGLEETVRFAGPSEANRTSRGTATTPGWVLPAYPAADLLIEPYLTGASGGCIRN